MSNIILCADDSKTMQTVAEITFRASDFQYVGATSADEALAKARAEKPALILADAVMPDKTGYDLCKMVKADPTLADVPVIMLCGNSSAYDAAKGSEVGADGHLSKPWDTQAMLDKVAELVAKHGGAAGKAVAATPAIGSIDKIKAPRLGTPPPVALTPKSPAALAAKAGALGTGMGKGRDPGGARTHTIMGMPTVQPPGPAAQPGTPPTPATPAPPRPPAPPTPAAVKPAMPPRPAVPQQPTPPRRPSTVPSKYAPPAMKSAITKPGIPDPPRPAPAFGEGDGRPTTAIPSQLGPSGAPVAPQPPTMPSPAITPAAVVKPPVVTPAAVTPAAPKPPVVTPAAAAPASPKPPVVAPAAASTPPVAGAKPTAAQPLGRPPMIRGIPARVPAFVAPAALRQVDVASVTRSAVTRAAAEVGLAADGPEVKALLALSHDVVERLVWEIVPDLAEAIIRENLDTLTSKH